jgi:hypothetical protein
MPGREGWPLGTRHTPRVSIEAREEICEEAWNGPGIATHLDAIGSDLPGFTRYGGATQPNGLSEEAAR